MLMDRVWCTEVLVGEEHQQGRKYTAQMYQDGRNMSADEYVDKYGTSGTYKIIDYYVNGDLNRYIDTELVIELGDQAQGGPGDKHVIQSGETLSSIANKYGTTVGELQRLNGISDPNKIIAGKTLKIGPGSGNSAFYNFVNKTRVDYSYRGEGQNVNMPLSQTPYGQYLIEQWKTFAPSMDFINWVPSNTTLIMFNNAQSIWNSLNWSQRTWYYDIGVDGMKAYWDNWNQLKGR
jgi:LysM repeat protein